MTFLLLGHLTAELYETVCILDNNVWLSRYPLDFRCSPEHSYPYAEYCKDLRKQGKWPEYFEFRNLFCLLTAYLDVSVKLMLSVCHIAVENESDKAEIKEACIKYRDRDKNNVFKFLWALTIDGSDFTGLSHEIEDMADTPNDGYREILKYIESV